MTRLIVGHIGQITLPDAVRQRYGLAPQMSLELARELVKWQSLSVETWGMFPDEEAGK